MRSPWFILKIILRPPFTPDQCRSCPLIFANLVPGSLEGKSMKNESYNFCGRLNCGLLGAVYMFHPCVLFLG